MLASLLFPYDDDAPKLIGGWLGELEREHCIVRYVVEGNSYIQVLNWLNHQKIDKPSQSKIPQFDESSRILANPREGSSEEGKGSKEGKGEEGVATTSPPTDEPKKSKSVTFTTWFRSIPEGESGIPEDHYVFEYADKVGLPRDFLSLAWDWFEDRYSTDGKKYVDWPCVFAKSVKGNWGKIWWIDDAGQYSLTTTGKQLLSASENAVLNKVAA
jgi:hypothetical protein